MRENTLKQTQKEQKLRFLGQRDFGRLWRAPLAEICGLFLPLYFKNRVKKGLVDLPYLELNLTTRCSLNCESCANLMQYFPANSQFSAKLEDIKFSLEQLFKIVSSIQRVRLIGGEPLIYKDILGVCKLLNNFSQIKQFEIVTNATIVPKSDLLDFLSKCKKFNRFFISDYSCSPNLDPKRLKQDELKDALKSSKIGYFSIKGEYFWADPEGIYARHRNEQENIEIFKSCGMKCVQLVPAEFCGSLGALFVCPVSSALSLLKGGEKFSGDFLSLKNPSPSDFYDFYIQEFFKSCDYCRDFRKPSKQITPAIQTDRTLKVID